MLDILAYYGTTNLGDAIQTVALSRWLPACGGVYRSEMGRAARKLIVSGWLAAEPLPPPELASFCGVHLAVPAALARYPYRGTIGVRDPLSLEHARSLGFKAELVGCATLTLPRYEGPRGHYTVSVDSFVKADVSLSHVIPRNMSWQEQWAGAIKCLDLYRKARTVYTSRLHVILPCLAFGTPVVFTGDRRFSLLGDSLVGPPIQFDPSPLRRAFLDFLRAAIGSDLEEHDPIYPAPCALQQPFFSSVTTLAVR